MTDRTCSVEECAGLITPKSARGLCPLHYGRLLRLGSVDLPPKMQDRPCSVDGCDTAARKRGWCAAHYSQWQREGVVRPFRYKWAAERLCLVCGKTEWEGKGRKFCSGACQQMHQRMIGRAPAVRVRPMSHAVTCRRCDSLIDLNETGNAGRRRRSDTLVCDPCRRAKWTRHGISVSVLHRRDGDRCGICSERIDMALTAPHLFRASVDHVIPYALGGPHTLDNAQLAHLWCNQVKHTREGFRI